MRDLSGGHDSRLIEALDLVAGRDEVSQLRSRHAEAELVGVEIRLEGAAEGDVDGNAAEVGVSTRGSRVEKEGMCGSERRFAPTVPGDEGHDEAGGAVDADAGVAEPARHQPLRDGHGGEAIMPWPHLSE